MQLRVLCQLSIFNLFGHNWSFELRPGLTIFSVFVSPSVLGEHKVVFRFAIWQICRRALRTPRLPSWQNVKPSVSTTTNPFLNIRPLVFTPGLVYSLVFNNKTRTHACNQDKTKCPRTDQPYSTDINIIYHWLCICRPWSRRGISVVSSELTLQVSTLSSPFVLATVDTPRFWAQPPALLAASELCSSPL